MRGVDASFALVKIGSGISISGRSNGKINVQLVLEKLNGGGHFDMAGGRMTGTTLAEACIALKHTLDDYLDKDYEEEKGSKRS